MADDNFDEGEAGDPTDDDRTGPLLRFDTAGTADLPHWSEPATGEMPVIDDADTRASSAAETGGSRLFPQLPDDPNMVDATAPEGFRTVGESLPSTVEELFADRTPAEAQVEAAADELEPTGPMSLDAAADLLAPRGDGAPEASAPAASAPEVEHSAGSDAGDDVDPDTTVIRGLGDESPAALAPALGFDAASPSQDPSADEGPPTGILEVVTGDERQAPIFEDPMDDDFPKAPDTSALFDDEAAPTAAPLGGGTDAAIGADPFSPDAAPAVAATTGGDEELDAWANLDGPSPHWREGSQDYEERAPVQEDERTVLHFDDGRGGDSGEPPAGGEPPAPPGGRNLPVAIAVGVTLAVAFFGLLSFSTAAAMGMVVVALVLAASEFFQSVRNLGYRPAVLLGLAATAGLALAAYWRGTDAYVIVLALFVMSGLLWFLFGVESEHATANLAITMLGVGWVGVLGSFAALILRQPHGDAIIIGAIIGTVGYDVGGYAIGSVTGQSRIAPHISPNKTYEGLIGGMIVSVLVTTVILSQYPGIFPWDGNMSNALWFGLAIAFAAPTGDLAQSLIKRDLGVKDMGNLLPGHGGVFDRFDALLFVLPAAYFVADVLDIGVPA